MRKNETVYENMVNAGERTPGSVLKFRVVSHNQISMPNLKH